METIGAYEAKTHLSQLLQRVSKGESFTITKHGVPVAVLQSPSALKRTDPREIIARLKDARKNCKLGGISIREMIEDGRR